MISYRIKCGDIDSGIWQWRDEEDFIAFLELMHTKYTPKIYRESPDEFNTIYNDEYYPGKFRQIPWHYVKEEL